MSRSSLPHKLLYTHASTLPFLRAYLLGFSADVIPSLLKLLLSLLSSNPTKKRSHSTPFWTLFIILRNALSPNSLGIAFGIAVGGAKWGEKRVEDLLTKLIRKTKTKSGNRDLEGNGADGEKDEIKVTAREEKAIKAASTFIAGTISSMLSILLLQSAKPSKPLHDPSLPSLSTSPIPISSRSQSPTLDLTLFLLVRATDSLLRGLYEFTQVEAGRYGKFWRAISSQADTLVFWLSTWRIMWCWFYLPERLPPTYVKWISGLARIDNNLLELLKYARNGEYLYGDLKPLKLQVTKCCETIAEVLGKDSSFILPNQITRLDCNVVHGKLGGPGSCQKNVAIRWSRAFLDSLKIYLPVHCIPHLLFGFGAMTRNPVGILWKILLHASRSSAFLATFVGSIFASVCLVRTKLPLLIPRLNSSQQLFDGGLATGLGCFVCGFSVLIENKRRRREMALYCAPRAIYAAMDEIVPTFLTRGKVGELLSRWIERSLFSVSGGIILATIVHRPDLVSGVVRGVMGKAVGDWGVVKEGEKGKKPSV